ncbi:ZMAT1 protein, partial [Alopecoenas beccarii]|nr:ZMAT1 protein [Alopecoenas beccarii]
DYILDEATRKDLFTNSFCKVCGTALQSESQRTLHHKGKKHTQKIHLYIQVHGEKDERQEHGKQKKMDCMSFQGDGSGVVSKTRHCNLCNAFFNSPVAVLSHYLEKHHTKMLKQLSGGQAHAPAQSMQPVSESSLSSNTRLKLNDSDKYCELCSAPFNNSFMAQQHYIGKKHRRNEARKKLLEELGDKAIPAGSSTNDSFLSALGVGYYLCSMCDIVLTSVESYQSHMQGNKHQIKKLVNLTNKSNRTHDFSQDDFMDYIEFRNSRCLEPSRCLGEAEQEEFRDENTEGRGDHGEVISSHFKCEHSQKSSLFSETQPLTNTGGNKSASWPLAGEHALEKTLNYCYNKGYCKEEQVSEVATVREKSFSLSVAESKDCYKLTLAETSTSSYVKDQKLHIKPCKEEKHISEELESKKEDTKLKRRKNSEGGDFGKENEKQKRIKLEIDLVNEKKSRPYKHIQLTENPAEKDSKNYRRDKKKSQPDVKREEELLWDESV